MKVEVQQHALGPLRQWSDCCVFFFFRETRRAFTPAKVADCTDRVTQCQFKITTQWGHQNYGSPQRQKRLEKGCRRTALGACSDQEYIQNQCTSVMTRDSRGRSNVIYETGRLTASALSGKESSSVLAPQFPYNTSAAFHRDLTRLSVMS